MKTEILVCFIGFIIAADPGPILAVEHRSEDAKTLSKDRVSPMIRDTPALHGRVAAVRARDSDNTTLHKSFRGGHITFTGALSPSGLAMRPIRYLLLDEIDRYPVSAGSEGDPVNLAKRRTDTFDLNKKIYICSSPTITGKSRIEKAYAASDQREFNVPCPFCGEFQVLVFDGLKIVNHDRADGVAVDAAYQCAKCQVLIPNFRKAWMVENGRWVAGNPKSRIPGFHANQLIVSHRTWGQIMEEFLEASKFMETLKSFRNTVLGLPFEEKHDVSLDEQALLSRCELYPNEVPDEVAVITAGVDTQDNRLEVELVGWGPGEESWSLAFFVISGDTSKPEAWNQLDEILKSQYQNESGVSLPIRSACIDSQGHRAASVYRFTEDRSRMARRIWAIRGAGGPKPIWPKKSGRGKYQVFTIGVDSAKDVVYSALKISEEGPRYAHFPRSQADVPGRDRYDLEHFEQLTSEKKYTRYKNGVAFFEWRLPNGVRNEALDCRVYAYAALHSQYSSGFNLTREAEKMRRLCEAARVSRLDMVPIPEKAPRPAAYARPAVYSSDPYL
jgi:phage terminase large subunit GpA-like protein